ncbi:MAG: response regulator transcription factor [Bacteroidales bacterium]|jgi:DNA-binding NarL/FixJ family response regulator|nr:response regulator transcription factor [Bacteroidales bacterium]
MKQHKNYRTVIIEPSPVIQEGIKLFLEKSPDFRVTACFADLQLFKSKPVKDDVQVVLFNPASVKFYRPFNVRSLFDAYPDVCLIAILYQYVDSETLQHFDGVLDIYDDGSVLPQRVIKIIESAQKRNDLTADNIDLSEREKEILISVARGMTNKEIADQHFISVHTVISHRKNITRKTGIKTVSGLTIYAIFNNLVSQDEL